MNIGQVIATRRKELGLTLEQVGDYVGVSKSTVKKWETGYIANMRRDKIALLARALKMQPTEFLAEETENSEEYEPSNISAIIPGDNIYKIPVFASVSAGLGAYAEENIIDYMPIVIDNSYDVPDMIGIKVKGDSMYPKIEDGDIIVVRKQESVDSGDVAVLLLDDNEGIVKKVVYGDDWIELHSFNPEYQTRRFDGPDVQRLRVVGKVLKVVKTI